MMKIPKHVAAVAVRTGSGELLIARIDVPRAPDGVAIGAKVHAHGEVVGVRVLA